MQYNKLISDMLAVFNGATTCAYNEPFRCGLRLEPGKTAQNFSTQKHSDTKLSCMKHLTLCIGQIYLVADNWPIDMVSRS